MKTSMSDSQILLISDKVIKFENLNNTGWQYKLIYLISNINNIIIKTINDSRVSSESLPLDMWEDTINNYVLQGFKAEWIKNRRSSTNFPILDNIILMKINMLMNYMISKRDYTTELKSKEIWNDYIKSTNKIVTEYIETGEMKRHYLETMNYYYEKVSEA